MLLGNECILKTYSYGKYRVDNSDFVESYSSADKNKLLELQSASVIETDDRYIVSMTGLLNINGKKELFSVNTTTLKEIPVINFAVYDTRKKQKILLETYIVKEAQTGSRQNIKAHLRTSINGQEVKENYIISHDL